MRKFIPLLFVFISSISFGHDMNQTERGIAEQQSIHDSYFYLGVNLSPVIQTFYPECGYRFQRDYLGYSVSFGANGKTHDYFFADLGINMLVFPKPNASSQFYLGLGLNQGYHTKKYTYSIPRTVYLSYYSYTYNKWYSHRTHTVLLYPTLFVGKDFSLSNGHKIFAEVTFIPGLYETRYRDWDWLTSAGFRLGYGF
ncbi:MAG: hypothetical protein H7A38_02240 [Chlamydiales bacterium]|nr:hypothetical protein [Chlamydiales bacterium]